MAKFAALQGSEIVLIAIFQNFKFLNSLKFNYFKFIFCKIFLKDKLTHQGRQNLYPKTFALTFCLNAIF